MTSHFAKNPLFLVASMVASRDTINDAREYLARARNVVYRRASSGGSVGGSVGDRSVM